MLARPTYRVDIQGYIEILLHPPQKKFENIPISNKLLYFQRERRGGGREGKSKALTKSYLQKNAIAEIPALGTQGKNKWQDWKNRKSKYVKEILYCQ